MEPGLLQADVALSQTTVLPTLPQGKGKDLDMQRIREVAEDFEAVYLGQMLKPMFEGISADGPFGGGQSEKMWQTLMVDEYGKSIAKSGGIGIADAVMNEMIRAQEAQ